MGSDLGVFEAMENAGKLSAESAATQGHELEKDIDRAIFRAKERFGAYLAGSQSKEDFEDRFGQVRRGDNGLPTLSSVVASVLTPTPGVMRRVGAALRPSLPQAKVPTKQVRPSSVKTATTVTASVEKTAWAFDKTTKLYMSTDPMQKFACPGCGTEQDHLGFIHCAGENCNRTWNSWPVKLAGSAKTGASTTLLMAREIKMRGDQFKLASMGNVQVTASVPVVVEVADTVVKTADGPMEPPPGVSQPTPGTMPGDNSGATGEPMPPEQPPTPGANSPDGDNDVAGGVTEGSPIDQIQDALGDAINALRDVQMLSINPQLSAMASTRVKGEKVAKLRDSMDKFWVLHKEMNYVAGMLAKEANEAIRANDPRISGEAEFVKGYYAAARNEPLPAKTGKVWLEGYVAFHKQAETYSDGADIGKLFVDTPDGESPGVRDDGTWTDGGAAESDEIRGDSGLYGGQPATADFASQMDEDNRQNKTKEQGSSGSIQPTGSRRPKGTK